MNNQIESLFAFLNSAKVKQKYDFYRAGGAAITGSNLPKSKIGFRLTKTEHATVVEDYGNMVPVSVIAAKIGRSNDSVRNILKKAGLYDKNRESISRQFEDFTTVKTQKA